MMKNEESNTRREKHQKICRKIKILKLLRFMTFFCPLFPVSYGLLCDPFYDGWMVEPEVRLKERSFLSFVGFNPGTVTVLC